MNLARRQRVSIAVCGCLVALFFFVTPALADTVTPSARAVHGVIVRKAPSTDSQRVGTLAPGEAAELTATVGTWRKVRLPNGNAGFVSSGWTHVVEGQAAASSPVPTHVGASSVSPNAPVPLLATGHPVDWWFVFKFNTKSFPQCGDGTSRECLFGGDVQTYPTGFSQQFVYASSENPTLQTGTGCLGDTATDPLGATFQEVYDHDLNYLLWNDQFYGDPAISGCSNSCSSPWGHSKGMLAWNDDGNGFVLQVSTPSWPAAGSKNVPRKNDGNTLGCVEDNDVKVSQHFFALRLTKDDLVKTLRALRNASVVTDPTNSQIVSNGGPADVQDLVSHLGTKSQSAGVMKDTLSSGVILISKPSALHVPPWQMVSAQLDGAALRAATWWATPYIYSSTATTHIGCWDTTVGTAGPVQIATTGNWNGTTLGLEGSPSSSGNHAKIGVSTAADSRYAIFGDLNQQGTLSGTNCGSSQNGRGGLFYVLDNRALRDSVAGLIAGDTAPTGPPS